MKPTGITVHILVVGAPLCNFTLAVPRDWPRDHEWVGQDDRQHATCTKCKQVYRELNKHD